MRAITSLRDLEDTYAAQTIALGGMSHEDEDFDSEEEDYWAALLAHVDAQ